MTFQSFFNREFHRIQITIQVIIQKMDLKENESSAQQTWKQYFTTWNLLRQWNPPFLIFALLYLLASVQYILPILVGISKAMDYKQSLFLLDIYGRLLVEYLQQSLSDRLIAGVATTLCTLVFCVFLILRANISEELIQNPIHRSPKIQFFRWLAYSLFNFQFLLSKQLLFPPISILATINFSFCCLIAYYKNTIFVSADLNNPPLVSQIYSNHDGSLLLIKTLLANFFLINCPIWLINQAALFFIMIISLFELHYVVFAVTYFHAEIDHVHIVRTIFEAALLFKCLLITFIKLDILISNHNLLQVVLFVFTYATVMKVRSHHQTNILISQAGQIESQKDAVVYILEMIKMSKQKRHLQMIRPYLVNQHYKHCKNASCFCSEYASVETFELAVNYTFMDSLFLQNIQEIKAKFSRSIWVLSLYINFKTLKNVCFSKVRHKLKQMMTAQNQLAFVEKYIIYQLERMTENHIQRFNRQRKSLPIEKVIELTNTETRLKSALKKIVEDLTKKYKLMSLQAFRLNDLAEYCDKINSQIVQIQQIWNIYEQTETSYNIEMNQEFLFYFQSIFPSFHQIRQLKNKVLDKTIKLMSLKGQYRKNMELAIHSEKTCILESLLDDDLGIITNATSSIFKVLGVEKAHAIGEHIHRLMPIYFIQGHKKVLTNWIQNQSFCTKRSVLAESCFVDINLCAFSCFTYIRVHSLGSTIKLYKMVIKNNDEDFLILNKQGKIEGIGSRLLMNGVFSKQHLKKHIGIFTSHDFFSKKGKNQEKQRVIFVPGHYARSENRSNLRSSQQFQQDRQELAFECYVSRRLHTVGETQYMSIQFFQIKQALINVALIDQSLRQSHESVAAHESPFQSHCQIVNAYSSQKVNFLPEQTQSDNKKLIEQSNSCAHSISSTKEGLKYFRIILTLKKMICNPDSIPLKKYLLVSITIFILSFLTIFLMFGFQIIFEKGLISFNQIVKSQQTVTSNGQILEIIYDSALSARTQCKVDALSDRCAYIKQSNNFMLNQFYQLFVKEVKNFFSDTTELNHIRLYEDFQSKTMLNLNQKSVQLTTLQFMQFIYQGLKRAQSQAESGDLSLPDQSMKMLFQNWQSLKAMTHNSISFYNTKSDEFLSVIIRNICLFISAVMICSWIFMYIIDHYTGYTNSKREQILMLYSHVSRKIASIFYNYFDKIRKENFQNTVAYPSKEIQGKHEGVNKQQHARNYNNYFVFLFFISGLPAGATILISVLRLLSQAKTMQNTTQAFLRTETVLVESYSSLKTYYLAYNFNKSVEQINSEILTHLNQTEVQFGDVAKQAVQQFSGLVEDKSVFNQKFNQLLTQSVCELTAGKFQKWQVQYCRNGTHYKTLQKGIMAGMYFLQRSTMEALIELRDSPSLNKTDYFKGKVFQDLDDYLFFMFRMFGLIQAHINEGFCSSVSYYLGLITFLDFLCAFIILAMLVTWIFNSNNQKIRQGQFYGYALQLPEGVFNKKQVLVELKQALYFPSK